MIPLQAFGGLELIVVIFNIILYACALFAVLGGFGYFLLRIRSGGSVNERLNRMERKIGRLEAQVEHLQDERGELSEYQENTGSTDDGAEP
jgi:hypothetical protein